MQRRLEEEERKRAEAAAAKERKAREKADAENAKLREQLDKAKAQAKAAPDPNERVDLFSGSVVTGDIGQAIARADR